ncbi:hypothetical protein [Streptomyces sp. NPDC031705]|uniref:hypothetical protein n=1 Tax=Streptomyces sp. NPDC031705 TaxID=3155729 RepID=UPI0033DB9E25
MWGVLGWILLDPDLRGVQEGLGWWMAAIALAPLLVTGVLIVLCDAPGEAGDDDGSDEVHWTHGSQGCGSMHRGCGG